jgi:outer membrane protein assembly factor BamB
VKKHTIFFNLFLLTALTTSCAKLTTLFQKPQAEPSVVVSWLKNLDPVYESGNLPIGLQMPAVDKDFVYIGADGQGFYGLEATTGREIWFAETPSHGFHSSSLRYKDLIIYGTDEGRIFARHYFTGKEEYSVDVGAAVEGRPVLCGERLLLHLRNHSLVALDVNTGKILWNTLRSVPLSLTSQGSSTPACQGNKIFVGFADGQVAAFQLEDGQLLWENRPNFGTKFIDLDAGPMLYGESLFIAGVSSSLQVINQQTGRLEKTLPFAVSRVPVLQNHLFIVATREGRIVEFNKEFDIVSDLSLHELWKNFRKKKNTPAVAMEGQRGTKRPIEARLWKTFSDKSELWAISFEEGVLAFLKRHPEVQGSERWEWVDDYDLGHRYSGAWAPLIVQGERLLVFSQRNRLYSFLWKSGR